MLHVVKGLQDIVGTNMTAYETLLVLQTLSELSDSACTMPGAIFRHRIRSQADQQLCLAPGYDKLLDQECLSDLTVQISEDPGADPKPRSGQETISLHAHKVILYVHSPCFQAKVRLASRAATPPLTCHQVAQKLAVPI
jgi:hypothetical protein